MFTVYNKKPEQSSGVALSPSSTDPAILKTQATAQSVMPELGNSSFDGSPLRLRAKSVLLCDTLTASKPAVKKLSFSPLNPATAQTALEKEPPLVTACRILIDEQPLKKESLSKKLEEILLQPKPVCELVLFYSYLQKDGNFIHKPSLLELKIEEMVHEINELNADHQSAYKIISKERLPSCVKDFILRSFVRLPISASGTFHIEGLEAIEALVQSKVGGHLRSAHREHILHVIKNMKADEDEIKTLFQLIEQNNLPIHPEIRPLLCLDWQLPPNSDLTPARIAWVVLKSLLDVSEQYEHSPTCYAIGPLNFITRAAPCSFLKKLFEILKNNKNNPLCIPLMYEDQIAFQNPLLQSTPVRAKEALDLPAIKRAAISWRQDTVEQASGKCFGESFKKEISLHVTALQINCLRKLVEIGCQIHSLNNPYMGHSVKEIFIECICKFMHSLPATQITKHQIDLVKAFFQNHIFFEEHIPAQVNFELTEDTIRQCHRKLIFKKADGSVQRFCTYGEFLLAMREANLFEKFVEILMSPAFKEHLDSFILYFTTEEGFPVFESLLKKNELVFPLSGSRTDSITQNYFINFKTALFTVKSSCFKTIVSESHKFVTEKKIETALLAGDNHIFVLSVHDLPTLTPDEFNKKIDAQKNAILKSCDTKLAPPSRNEWKEVCKLLKLEKTPLKIVRSIALSKHTHPFKLATIVVQHLYKNGYTTTSVFEAYEAICSVMNCSMALPFAELNWIGSGPAADQNDFTLLGLGYNKDSNTFLPFELNSDDDMCCFSDLKIDKLIMVYKHSVE